VSQWNWGIQTLYLTFLYYQSLGYCILFNQDSRTDSFGNGGCPRSDALGRVHACIAHVSAENVGNPFE